MTQVTAAYIRADPATDSYELQKDLISRYCQANGLDVIRFFEDTGTHDRHKDETARAKQLGLPDSKWLPVLPEWEKLMLLVKEGRIRKILVDTKYRLYGTSSQTRELYEGLTAEYDVQIIQVAAEPLGISSDLVAAIYHFTESSQSRPVVLLKKLDSLYTMSKSMGVSVDCVLIDDVLYHRNYYQRLLHFIRTGVVDVVMLSSAYHLVRSMNTMYHLLVEFHMRGVKLITQKEGRIGLISAGEYMKEHLRVAIYDRVQGPAEKELQKLLIARMELYIKTRTKWTLCGIYIASDNDKEEKVFNDLEAHKQEFDLVLIDHLGALDKYVTSFFMKWKTLEKKIFCLRNEVVFG